MGANGNGVAAAWAPPGGVPGGLGTMGVPPGTLTCSWRVKPARKLRR